MSFIYYIWKACPDKNSSPTSSSCLVGLSAYPPMCSNPRFDYGTVVQRSSLGRVTTPLLRASRISLYDSMLEVRPLCQYDVPAKYDIVHASHPFLLSCYGQ